MERTRELLACLALAAAATAFPARASQEAPKAAASPAPHDPFHVSWSADLLVTGALFESFLMLSVLKKEITGNECKWCSGPGAADRAFRSALLAPDTKAADTASSVLLLGVLPAFIILADVLPVKLRGEKLSTAAEDLALIAESVAVTMAVTYVFKFATRRTRPYAYFGGDDSMDGGKAEDVLSFFSLHVALAASLAASAATVSFLRGRKIAPAVAAVGAGLAVTVGLLRISSDNHYMSDVLASLAVGTLVGVAIPYLHTLKFKRKGKGGSGDAVTVTAMPGLGGAAVSGFF